MTVRGTFARVMRDIEQRLLCDDAFHPQREDEERARRRQGASHAAWKALWDHLGAARLDPALAASDEAVVTTAAFRAIVLAIANTGGGLRVIDTMYSVLAEHKKRESVKGAKLKLVEARENAGDAYAAWVAKHDGNWSAFAEWYLSHLKKQGIHVSVDTIRTHWKPGYLK